jgi:hypothetical protein
MYAVWTVYYPLSMKHELHTELQVRVPRMFLSLIFTQWAYNRTVPQEGAKERNRNYEHGVKSQ